ncbi:HlyD family efflux transporter periplasmic adaptor subunit [uncultured Hyphomonas sp.]|jgi:cobalt-zinc-cadmium efflux system membrane fusion protein|uniref:efflux RND transporter periplasmic adaptor subunit n=1 Tax=uncultured Hyphomonas sp. TaxID=225298 RepID=UPI0030D973A2|tara:strand:+ start:24186 stop:25442 length:1257 start_codon:yes stop_codon:yes gene_type:complete
MNPRILYPVAAAGFAALMTLTGCGSQNSASGDGDNIHAGAEEAEAAEGPHGGRLLEEGDFALEMTIFESGVPPEYRIYPFLAGEPVDPSRVALTVRLDRLGDEEDLFGFSPVQDYLKGDGVVTEPHSFEVFIDAQYQGTSYSWSYESFEGRTTIADDTAVSMGVETEIAGAAVIRDIIPLSGVTALSPSATAEVRARYPGPVQSVSVGVNDMVRKGQTLARVESSSSLQSYSVTAPVSGTILERNTNAGDVAGDQSLFTIADLNQLEARLHVFPKDAGKVKTGQSVRMGVAGSDLEYTSEITRFLPISGGNTQTRIAVAPVPVEAAMTPGMRVMASVVTGESEVPLAVRESGLQSFRDFTVVYAKVGETYEVRMLDLGESDGEFIEVLGGLDPGTEYVSGNSFLIKADIEKSGASHDH